jgi:hypothetical protein
MFGDNNADSMPGFIIHSESTIDEIINLANYVHLLGGGRWDKYQDGFYIANKTGEIAKVNCFDGTWQIIERQ